MKLIILIMLLMYCIFNRLMLVKYIYKKIVKNILIVLIINDCCKIYEFYWIFYFW